MSRSFYDGLYWLSQEWISLPSRIQDMLWIIQGVYYPILAVVGVPVNIMTIMTLSRKKCGLTKCVSCYLVAMSVTDLLVIIIDLIMRQIPVVYYVHFTFLYFVPVCNIHAVMLYAVTDCSVWFTVTFSFDRFLAICCQKLKSKYCNAKTAAVVLGTVTVVSFFKNIFWYFMLTDQYWLMNRPWFCRVTMDIRKSLFWVTMEFVHHILTPGLPFILILLLNIFTIRHILVTNQARKRLVGPSAGDPELQSRRKSIILLFVISANFILLWSMIMVYSIWSRMVSLGFFSIWLNDFVQELGFMLQLLSCCTNTVIYAVTQTKFRQQLKSAMKYPFTSIIQCIQ
ncbi:probable G-protein coupled receptor 139 [Stegostoma tigrinum]|uniref:probable G-protein coupled receptor 139 n=1 Tax=Stegostoma tigrinum TaxID=3053191 RepID=UPI00286FAFFF|nr:probable G-protein coupled receptor 139 [Stegostoma tigrinum]XP_059500018.1 probable G-protein coupled receptor 139 [Stegostoma tigrinum]